MLVIRLAFVLVLALIIGVWVWICIRRNAKPERFLPILLVTGLLCRVIFLFFTPLLYAPDEGSHLRYIAYLAEQKSLPIQKHMWGDTSHDWEFSQPPLYYLLLTPVFEGANEIFPSSGIVVLALRFCSVALWALNVWLGWLLLKRAQITDPGVRNFVMAMLCLLPTYTFTSAMINNDNLLATLGTALLCLMRGRLSYASALGIGVLLGLALLTKQSAVVFLPAILVLFCLTAFKSRADWFSALIQLGSTFGIALIMFGPWLWRNWKVYGSLTPEQVFVSHRAWSSPIQGLGSAVHNVIKTFWAVSGGFNEFSYPFPLIGIGFMILCLGFHKPTPSSDADMGRERKNVGIGLANLAMNHPFLTACFVGIIVNLLLVVQFGYRFGMGQGRHLFPLLWPIALFAALRWRTFPVRASETWTTAIWIAYALGFLAFSLFRFPRPP